MMRMLDAFRDTALAAATAAEDKSLVWRRDFNNFDRKSTPSCFSIFEFWFVLNVCVRVRACMSSRLVVLM